MKEVSVRVRAENGKPIFLSEVGKKKFYEFLIKNEGIELNLTIGSNGFEPKTNQQLRYLWGVVYPIISDYTGFTEEEVHETYKKKFLSYDKEVKGKIHKFTKGLSQCSLEEAMVFIDKVVMHGRIDLSLVIPEAELT